MVQGDVTLLVVEHKADIHAEMGAYSNALQAAASWGQENVAQLLIDHGADVNANRGHYGNALQAAASGGT